MHTFTSHNYDYRVLDNGVIEQINPQPYKYDAPYVQTYDTEAYRRGNETLQALRYGFLCGAHGKPPASILDVGCANGAFLKFSQQHTPCSFGFDVTGEPVEGVQMVDSFVPAEVYTFHDVLEHIQDCSFLHNLQCKTISVSLPYCHYNALYDLAKAFGLRCVYVLAKDFFDNNYKHRKPNEHVRHFDALSLKAFMQQYGWETVAQSTHEDIVRKSIHGLPNILSMGFKRM